MEYKSHNNTISHTFIYLRYIVISLVSVPNGTHSTFSVKHRVKKTS